MQKGWSHSLGCWLSQLNAFETFCKCFIANYNHYANTIPANIYLFKINNRKIRKRCETCSKLTIKPLGRCRSGVFLVNVKQTSQIFLVFLSLTEVSLWQNGECLTIALTWPGRICEVYKMVAYTLEIMSQI